ncbi:hypothetical protein RHS04_00504 [Rhizoctonia solani]|uniref:Uncharacterized protein n=1 Tax=Rhizoctonia solani TaxID=456999 RepID=A0A8H7HEQ1_9AGAM|nr:hypothetical protein RHS04_00504 [Rhizoctonia solani]KAF8755288.1 hypothetical protein RHS01_05493 [Rhizoctonia solani]
MRAHSIISVLLAAYTAYAQATALLSSTNYRPSLSTNSSSSYSLDSSGTPTSTSGRPVVTFIETVLPSFRPSVVAITVECPWASGSVYTTSRPSPTRNTLNPSGFSGTITTTTAPASSFTEGSSLASFSRPIGTPSYSIANTTISIPPHSIVTVCISFSTIGTPGTIYTTYDPSPTGGVFSTHLSGPIYSGNVSTTYRLRPSGISLILISPIPVTSYTRYIPESTIIPSATPAPNTPTVNP